MKKLLATILICCMATVPLMSEDISFSGGYTRMATENGEQVITLEDNARVQVGDLSIQADSIRLSGPSFGQIACDGAVSVSDPANGYSLVTSSLHYDRDAQLLVVDSWVELQDTANGVAASGGWLRFDLGEKKLVMQVHVRLLDDTDDGPMVCTADSIRFDRETEQLFLEGDANIDWKKDRYKAETIYIDLGTQEIRLDGAIEGVVNG
jgi:lipopolysaccharide export system protein LptA